MEKEKAVSSFSHPIKTAYPSAETVDIIFKYRWKPEMMHVMAESAAAQDVNQLIERHITVLLTECAALQTAILKAKNMCEAYIHFTIRMIKE